MSAGDPVSVLIRKGMLEGWKGREGLGEEKPARLEREQSFEELYRQYYPRLVRHLAFLLGERPAAEEVAQETFLKLYSEPPLRAENLEGWLMQVGSRLALNTLRGERRRRQLEEKLACHGQEVVHLEEAVMRRCTVREVRRVLDALNPRDRLALLLRHAGFTYREIAAALGVAPGSVGTILARAQKSFLAHYEKGKEGEGGELL